MTTLAEPYRPEPYILDRNTSPAFWLVATLWMPMATGYQTANRFSLIEQWMPTGLGPPTHRHARANEGFYVLDGTVAFNAEGRTLHSGAGTFIHIPRMMPHSFSVDTQNAHVLNFYAPAGFELVVMSMAMPAPERRRPSIEESPPPDLEQVRILSRLFGQEEVRALPFCQPSLPPMMMTKPTGKAFGELKTARAADIAGVSAFGMNWRVLVGSGDTDGTYDLSEVLVPNGAGMPTRILGQDEILYVLEGSLEMSFDGERRHASEGSLVYCPAHSAFSWIAQVEARVLVFHLPGCFDQALYRSSGDLLLMKEIMRASGTRFLATGR